MLIRGKIYNLTMKNPAIIPGDFSGVKILRVKGLEDIRESAILDINQSMGLGAFDTDEDFYDIRLQNGTTFTVADSWLLESHIVNGNTLYELHVTNLNSATADSFKTLLISLGGDVKVIEQTM